MTMYGQVMDGEAVIRLLKEYDNLHLTGDQFNRGDMLEQGGRSAKNNYAGARIALQIQHTDDGIKVGLARFAWNDEPDAVFLDGTYEGRPIAGGHATGPDGELVPAPEVVHIDPANPPKKGDPSPDGSGLIYAGDKNIGGDMRYSGEWVRPFDLLKAEFIPGVDEDGDGLDDASGAALGAVADPFSPTGWSLAVNKDGSLP